MRRWCCVPMMTLFLLLVSCGSSGKGEAENWRSRYQSMTGCTMEAAVTCDQKGLEWEGTLRCAYTVDGESTVEVLAPETIAGIKAVISEKDWHLEYEGDVLNMGTLTPEKVSPADSLPRLMNALRNGWLLEENEEQWNEETCLRVSVDQTGEQGAKIVSTVWLRQTDGTPLRAEIAVDGEIILTAEFTNFTFYDTVKAE